jgi:DNA segregation ATPase FtsK/SpoIIIE-like protein
MANTPFQVALIPWSQVRMAYNSCCRCFRNKTERVRNFHFLPFGNDAVLTSVGSGNFQIMFGGTLIQHSVSGVRNWLWKQRKTAFVWVWKKTCGHIVLYKTFLHLRRKLSKKGRKKKTTNTLTFQADSPFFEKQVPSASRHHTNLPEVCLLSHSSRLICMCALHGDIHLCHWPAPDNRGEGI